MSFRGVGSGLDLFYISSGCLTVRHSTNDDRQFWFLCVLPNISGGAHDLTFRIDKISESKIGLCVGVVPPASVSSSKSLSGSHVRYTYDAFGDFWALGDEIDSGDGFGVGAAVTVRVGQDANTIAFLKNGTDIEFACANVSAFKAYTAGNTAAIMEDTK